jgi:hypothetical protein
MEIPESSGIMKRTKDANEVMWWSLVIGGQKVQILLNGKSNHFGKKHLLLPAAEGRRSKPKPGVEEAVVKRQKSRSDGSDSHTQKYFNRIGNGTPSTVLNLRPYDNGMHEKVAAVYFAQALLEHKGKAVGTEVKDVIIEFGEYKCVYICKPNDKVKVTVTDKMTVSFKIIGENVFEIVHCSQ